MKKQLKKIRVELELASRALERIADAMEDELKLKRGRLVQDAKGVYCYYLSAEDTDREVIHTTPQVNQEGP